MQVFWSVMSVVYFSIWVTVFISDLSVTLQTDLVTFPGSARLGIGLPFCNLCRFGTIEFFGQLLILQTGVFEHFGVTEAVQVGAFFFVANLDGIAAFIFGAADV
jgi:hypothetical protein